MTEPYWEPLAASPTIYPQTVVNGQWIKGVGGVPVWSPIKLDDITEFYKRIVVGMVAFDGTVQLGSHFTVAHPSTGNYTITFDSSVVFSNPMFLCSSQSQSQVIGGRMISTTQAMVFITTPGAWTDGYFSFMAYDGLLNSH